jgi:hypothetical protein
VATRLRTQLLMGVREREIEGGERHLTPAAQLDRDRYPL